jgi:hypothetical protein
VGLLFLLLLSGCSDGPGAKLAPVTGRVTFKNEAVTAAEIYFNPDAKKGNEGELGTALLAADGTFTITTHHPKGPRNGVAPGAYKVTFGLGRRPEKELIKFRTVQATPLAIEVPEEGLQDVVVDLDKGRIDVK